VKIERKCEGVKILDKELLKEMLAEMFREGIININAEYSGIIQIEIDGECVQVVKL
jgi:hypothetical protein